ncbi:hypothetical protein HK105_207239 [Polyrhizophydium stewartii]|uniref:GLTSCR protein conserved domain-containing protein n=1 Tax=Polyrhizophydium stewartii TaxID=2732419 RepID=A0ABR4N133_9FUNG
MPTPGGLSAARSDLAAAAASSNPRDYSTPAELEHQAAVDERFRTAAMQTDMAVLSPDRSAFASIDDAIARLLPFHVFQHHDMKPIEIDFDEDAQIVDRAQAIVERFRRYTQHEEKAC